MPRTRRKATTVSDMLRSKDTSYECSECGVVFDKEHKLTKHMSVHEIFVGKWCCFEEKKKQISGGHACKHCNEILSTKTDLEVHTQRVHVSQLPFECMTCHKHFGRIFICINKGVSII